MDRRIQYELLQNEEEVPAEEVPVHVAEIQENESSSVVDPSAPSEGSPEETADQQLAEQVKIPEPPSYSIATSLPTYEEAEQTKESEEQLRQQRELEEEQSQSGNNNNHKIGDVYLGTDGIFICSFLLAFLFNCIGLFAILCVSQTIAARFGAVSGFGLSIVKYVALLKYQNWLAEWNDGFSWLWWFMLFLGLLMFFRGSMQYIRIKYQWSKLSQQTRGRIFFPFRNSAVTYFSMAEDLY